MRIRRADRATCLVLPKRERPTGEPEERKGNANEPGLGSVRSDESERMTLRIERAGDQLFLRMSRQIPPLSDFDEEISEGAGAQRFLFRREQRRRRRRATAVRPSAPGREKLESRDTHDVAVVDLCSELKLWSCEGIVGREVNVDLRGKERKGRRSE